MQFKNIFVINREKFQSSRKGKIISVGPLEDNSGFDLLIQSWVDINEKPSNSARRELYEETGYKANSIKKLIEFYEEPGRMVSKAFCFYSEKLTKINIPEKGIKIALYSKQEMINLINTKKFNAGNHIAAFYKYLYLKKI